MLGKNTTQKKKVNTLSLFLLLDDDDDDPLLTYFVSFCIVDEDGIEDVMATTTTTTTKRRASSSSRRSSNSAYSFVSSLAWGGSGRVRKSLTRNTNASEKKATGLALLKGVVEDERVIRDENGKDVTPRSLMEACRWTTKNAFGEEEEEEEESEEEEEEEGDESDEESNTSKNEEERRMKNDNDIDAILNVDFSKLWERHNARQSRRITLAPIEIATTPPTTRKKNRIKKKRVPFDPETHAHRSTQTYTPPCIARETSTDSPKTKESETCWKVEEKQRGRERSKRARKRIDRAFLEHAGTIVDRQIRASLTLEQTLRYKGIIVKDTDKNEVLFAGSEKLTRLRTYKYPSASSSESGKEKRVNAIRFHPRLDGVIASCHGSVDAAEFVQRGDDYDDKDREKKHNVEHFNNRGLEKSGAIHIWTLRDSTKAEVSFTLETAVTSIAFQRARYDDPEYQIKNKGKRILCGCFDGSIRCFDIAFRGNKGVGASHQRLLYESRPKHSHKEPVWTVDFINDSMDEGSQCEFSTMSCSTDGAVLKMDARAIIPSESFGTSRILNDGQHRYKKQFMESDGKTILNKGLACDDPREIQATCLDVIDQSHFMIGTVRGDVFVCAKHSPINAINESDGHTDMFKIIKKIKAHSISSLNAPIYQIKKHPFVPGVFATASADGTVRVFRVDMKRDVTSETRDRETHTSNINDTLPQNTSSIFKETDTSQIFAFVPAPSRDENGKETRSSSSATSSVWPPPVNDIAWDTNDGRKIAAVYDDDKLRIWNCERAVVQSSSNCKNVARNDVSLTVTSPWFEEKFEDVGIQQPKEKKNNLHLTAVCYSNKNASPILAVGDNLGNVHLLSVGVIQKEEDNMNEYNAIDYESIFLVPDTTYAHKR